VSATKAIRWLPWAALIAIWVFLAVRFYASFVLRTPYGQTWAVADDVYVTADFARTLLQGEGLKWHPGAERVEGFSSPTWVLVLAALHTLPGFQEDRLGLYVLGATLAILAAIVVVLRVVLYRARSLASPLAGEPNPLRSDALFVALAVPAGLALVCFAAAGFEVALVALLVLAACAAALRPEGPSVSRTAVLVGLAIWTRMDAVLPVCAATGFLLIGRPPPRKLAVFAAIVLGMVGAMFAARRAYYGAWFPNTYYLKATGWPLSQRFPHGSWQNFPALAAFLGLIPFGSVVAWRALRGAREVVPLLLATHFAVVAYSTALGGDIVFEAFGFDRFTCVTALFVPLAVSLGARGLGARKWHLLAIALGAVGIWIPVVYRPGFMNAFQWRDQSLWRSLFHFRKPLTLKETNVQSWVQTGKALERVTRPRARIAVCAAGAPIYFSHREGVDLLGKVDPYVARLPAARTPPPEARCWRGFGPVGHNKEDVIGSFRRHNPDVSLVAPPASVARQFKHVTYDDIEIWVRFRSRQIHWKRLRGR
jgi:hypothetical protein